MAVHLEIRHTTTYKCATPGHSAAPRRVFAARRHARAPAQLVRKDDSSVQDLLGGRSAGKQYNRDGVLGAQRRTDIHDLVSWRPLWRKTGRGVPP